MKKGGEILEMLWGAEGFGNDLAQRFYIIIIF